MRAWQGFRFLVVIETAAAGQQFEVASVRMSEQDEVRAGGRVGGVGSGGACPQSIRVNRDRVEIRCATLLALIGYAFRISPERVVGVESATRFDIAAKMPEGVPDRQVPEMVQGLLADRFRLVCHHGTTNQSIYGLVVSKGGPRLEKAAAEVEAAPEGAMTFFGSVIGSATTMSNPRMGVVRVIDADQRTQRWEASSTTLAGLADLIDRAAPFLSAPVADMTGVSGRYRLSLQVTLPSDVSAAEMEGAVVRAFNDGLRKLGLRLERRRGPVESVVVDHIEKMPTAN